MANFNWQYVAFGAAGAGACLYALYYIALAIRSIRWPSVEGEIAQTRIVRRGDVDASTDFPYVAYRYTVNGKPYRNDRVRFGPVVTPESVVPALDSSRPADAALEDRYPVRSPVKVYYNPKDPADSVLQPVPDWPVALVLVIGVFFLYGAGTHLLRT